MKQIVIINASPRKGWNTAQVMESVANGCEEVGAKVEVFDLYKLDRYTGCISCFSCKVGKNEGVCIYKDGLAPVLEAIRHADGVVIGTPNYLGNPSAGFLSLYERLIFQLITYNKEMPRYKAPLIPVLFVMTSNAGEELYQDGIYQDLLSKYASTLNQFVGPTKTMLIGNTLQVKDYSRFNWTMFDSQEKQERHETIFPKELKKAFNLGKLLVNGEWEEGRV